MQGKDPAFLPARTFGLTVCSPCGLAWAWHHRCYWNYRGQKGFQSSPPECGLGEALLWTHPGMSPCLTAHCVKITPTTTSMSYYYPHVSRAF